MQAFADAEATATTEADRGKNIWGTDTGCGCLGAGVECGCALVGCAHDPFSINLLAAVGAPSPSSSASPWARPWVQWLRRQTTTKSVSTTCPPSPSPSPTLLRFMATYDQVQPASCSPPSRMLPSLASPCYSTAQSSCGLTQSKQRMHSVSTQVNQPTHCPTA